MKAKLSVFVILAAMMLTSCEGNEVTTDKHEVTIRTGIYGTVTERYGNWMPVVDPNDTTHGIRPIAWDIYVYEYTTMEDIIATGYQAYMLMPVELMPKPLVATARSESDGFYQITLKPGIYSVFLPENGIIHPTSGNGYGAMFPITVPADSALHVDFMLNHGVD